MIASVRYTEGLGDSALYLRGRNVLGRYWNWVTLAWAVNETADSRVALAEQADSDPSESRYTATVAAPSGQWTLEYVLTDTDEVVAEESALPATLTHAASLRFTSGFGDHAIYVRARDGAGRYWDWTLGAWSATEIAACRSFLLEYADSDPDESRYSIEVVLPEDYQVILEYVRASNLTVLAEETVGRLQTQALESVSASITSSFISAVVTD